MVSKLASRIMILMIGILMILVSGCNGGRSADQTWTIMVYMSGNGTLSDQVFVNLNEMEKFGTGPGVNIIALAQNNSLEKSRLYRVMKNNHPSGDPKEVVSPYQEYDQKLDLWDYHTLEDFVRRVFTQYPADKYMLIVWNHGSGIDDKYGSSSLTSRSICAEETSPGHEIKISELGGVMQRVTQVHPIDIVATDACLMGMYEFAYELKDAHVKYMAFSEAVEPGDGFPYDYPWLANLNGSSDPCDLCSNLARDYGNYYRSKNLGGYTFSVLNMSKFAEPGGTATRYNQLANQLAHADSAAITAIQGIVPNCQHFSDNNDDPPYSFVDLYDFCSRLAALNICKAEADALMANLVVGPNNVIVAEGHYTKVGDISYDNSHGLSTLITNSGSISYDNYWKNSYPHLKYYTDGNHDWESFLKRISP